MITWLDKLLGTGRKKAKTAVAKADRLPCDPLCARNAQARARVAAIIEATGYEVLYDVRVELADGRTVRIDHIARINGALVAVMSKGWDGWISAADKNVWTVMGRSVEVRVASPRAVLSRRAAALKKLYGGTWAEIVVMDGNGPVPTVEGVVVSDRLAGRLGGIAARNPRNAKADEAWRRLRADHLGQDPSIADVA